MVGFNSLPMHSNNYERDKKVENLYKIINQFNKVFGYKGNVICDHASESHLYFKIDYPELVIDKKQKQYSICNKRNNYAMCSVWIDYDKFKPNNRPKFILWNDNIYSNKYIMPDHNIIKLFYKKRKQFFRCEAEILFGSNEIYISNKQMDTFIKYCEKEIYKCKDSISSGCKLKDINEYAERIVDLYKIKILLELEMKFRKEEKENSHGK